ncbi:unannotated protein [freshwater metagenome]|uniref:Unannotated protein n=1 Tax=freshwater metagenome TaxID=449393 RepID=A0A6J7D9C3_9ZZZZ
MTADRHCHHCGARHTDTGLHPQCPECGEWCWRNPAPVAVCLTAVVDATDGRTGLLLGRRAIEPRGWSLPGGFIELGEQLADAALRELHEETAMIPASTAVETVDARSVSDGTQLLVFCRTGPLELDALGTFAPNEECDALTVAWSQPDLEGAQLVFPLHAEQAARELRRLMDA